MLNFIKRKKSHDIDPVMLRPSRGFGSISGGYEPEDFLDPDFDDVDALIDHIQRTQGWANDFAPQDPLDKARMLQIWKLRVMNSQVWYVKTMRERMSRKGPVTKSITVLEHNDFPTKSLIEEVAYSRGFGGGTYNITTAKGSFAMRVQISGDEENPYEAELTKTEKEWLEGEPAKNPFAELKQTLAMAYAKNLASDPEAVAAIGEAIVAKELGIKLTSKKAEEAAPVTVGEFMEALSDEERTILANNPDLQEKLVGQIMSKRFGISVSALRGKKEKSFMEEYREFKAIERELASESNGDGGNIVTQIGRGLAGMITNPDFMAGAGNAMRQLQANNQRNNPTTVTTGPVPTALPQGRTDPRRSTPVAQQPPQRQNVSQAVSRPVRSQSEGEATLVKVPDAINTNEDDGDDMRATSSEIEIVGSGGSLGKATKQLEPSTNNQSSGEAALISTEEIVTKSKPKPAAPPVQGFGGSYYLKYPALAEQAGNRTDGLWVADPAPNAAEARAEIAEYLDGMNPQQWFIGLDWNGIYENIQHSPRQFAEWLLGQQDNANMNRLAIALTNTHPDTMFYIISEGATHPMLQGTTAGILCQSLNEQRDVLATVMAVLQENAKLADMEPQFPSDQWPPNQEDR